MVLTDDALSLILSRLTVDLLYRLFFSSSKVRTILNKHSFWKGLIKRDLGLLPNFPIDHKLYYLRADGLRIRGAIWESKNKKFVKKRFLPDRYKKSDLRALYLIDAESYIGIDERYHSSKGTIAPPSGDRFRELVELPNSGPRLLTYSGKLIGLDGVEDTTFSAISGIVKITMLDVVSNTIFILTRDGSLYESINGVHTKLPLPHPAIHIVGNMILDQEGDIYTYLPNNLGLPPMPPGAQNILQMMFGGNPPAPQVNVPVNWANIAANLAQVPVANPGPNLGPNLAQALAGGAPLIPVGNNGQLLLNSQQRRWIFGKYQIAADETIQGVTFPVGSNIILGGRSIDQILGEIAFIDENLKLLSYEGNMSRQGNSIGFAITFGYQAIFGNGVLQVDNKQIRVLER